VLDGARFQHCFIAWAASLTGLGADIVAIDGKTHRRSYQEAGAKAPIHMISAWSVGQNLVLGQAKVADKSNEIVAIPKLLALLTIKGATETIDAMGCQRKIAARIIDKDANYILACKGNQGALDGDIELFLTEQAARGFWCADITYIPLARGFPYPVAVMDWSSRTVLAWRLSNTMDVRFCIDALEEALGRYGPPAIFNTDRGSPLTSHAWTQRLRDTGIRISMDGRGRFLDNIFIERLWRSLKYECVYPHAFSGGRDARKGIGRWIDFHNNRRRHAAHGGATPGSVYRDRPPVSGPGLRPDLQPTVLAA
jgi:transposase InsO family protein